MVCPELTEQIRREIAASLHQRKGDFACYFLTDLVTFTLPAGTRDIIYVHISICPSRFLNIIVASVQNTSIRAYFSSKLYTCVDFYIVLSG